jgi:hypothetical protein
LDKKLSEIIKEIEDVGGLSDYYVHHNYYLGTLELNIEFNNEVADTILKKNEIKKIESCAYWE